jgi:hypothetical protein
MAVTRKGDMLVRYEWVLPALRHKGGEPKVAGGFGHRLPSLCDERDRFPFAFGGRGPAFVCHYGHLLPLSYQRLQGVRFY